MTDMQLKILKYVTKRKTPPDAKEVGLQSKVSRAHANRVLLQLVRMGYLKTYLERTIYNGSRRLYITKEAYTAKFGSEKTERPRNFTKKSNVSWNNPFGLRV